MLCHAVRWPTATSDTSNRDKRYAQGGLPLAAAVRWPTATSRDHKDGSAEACANVPVNGLLGRFIHVEQKWPTPNTMTGGQTSRGGDRKGEALLGGMVKWPTPAASTGDGGPHGLEGGSGNAKRAKQLGVTSGSLNPDWVELLMGWPSGWTSLEPLDALDWPAAHGAWPAPPGPQHEWEPPRVAVGVKDRVKRLKALGNGQVPQTAALAWEVLGA